MPSDERIWFHDGEEATPLDQRRQRDERYPCRIIGAARLHLSLHIQCKLLSQEQLLGSKVCLRSSGRRDQPQEIAGDAQNGSKRGDGTRLCHGRRIVADAVAQPRPSPKYWTHPIGAAREQFATFLRRFGLLRITIRV